jgi:hypothetical protein
MTKSEQKSVRLSAETVRKIEELARIWGPVKPLSFADVVSVMTDKVFSQEASIKGCRSPRGS